MTYQIEVRNLKTLASLSEETHCYTATIYVNGKPAFEASNHGHGGADLYRPIAPFTYEDEKKIEEFLAASKPVISSGTRPDGSTWELRHGLEIEVGEQIENIIATKRLNRILKSQIAVITDRGLATYPKRFAPTPANIATIKARGEKVVNGDAELEKQALALV